MDLLHPQPPAVAVIDPRLCQGCGACAAACPMQAIRLREGYCAVEPTWCAGCGACVQLCPHHAPGWTALARAHPEQKDRAPWGNPSPDASTEKHRVPLGTRCFWFEGQVTPSRPWRGRLCSPWRP